MIIWLSCVFDFPDILQVNSPSASSLLFHIWVPISPPYNSKKKCSKSNNPNPNPNPKKCSVYPFVHQIIGPTPYSLSIQNTKVHLRNTVLSLLEIKTNLLCN